MRDVIERVEQYPLRPFNRLQSEKRRYGVVSRRTRECHDGSTLGPK